MGRKNRDDDLALLNMINENISAKANPTSQGSKKKNVFAFVQSDDVDDEDTDNLETLEDHKPVKQTPIANKKKLSKKKKRKANLKIIHSDTSPSESEDDDEINKLLKDIKLTNTTNKSAKEKMDIRNLNEKMRMSMGSLLDDTGYTEFMPYYATILEDLYNPLDPAIANKKKYLDFEVELGLLFDDLDKETLSDDFMETSHPQLKALKRMIKPWGVKKNGAEVVPQGKSLSKTLKFAHVRADYIPTWFSAYQMEKLNTDEYVLQNWEHERINDWKDVIKADFNELKDLKKFTYYKIAPADVENNVKTTTSFYLNIQLSQDVNQFMTEARHFHNYYNLLYIYQMLQVLLIQSSSIDQNNDKFPEINSLLNRAVFVVDRSLKRQFEFNGFNQLPYNYFYNRIYYLVLLQYTRVLNSKGLYRTVGEWCKAILSLSPVEDPMGIKYFAGDCWIRSSDYQWIVDYCESGLVNKYKEWKCLNILLSGVLALIRLEDEVKLKEFLKKHFFVKDNNNACLNQSQYTLNWGMNNFLKIALKQIETYEKNAYISEYDELCLQFYLQSYKDIWTAEDLQYLNNIWSKIDNVIIKNDNILNKNASNVTNAHFIRGIPTNFIRMNIIISNNPILSQMSILNDKNIKNYPFDPLPNVDSSFDHIEDFVNKGLLSQMYENRLMTEDIEIPGML